jgi:hydroxyethylthiazole kinase-like uncharacterized protein yjeF
LKKINWQAPLKLFDVAQTRQLEVAATALNSGPPSLMESAGLAIAKLAMAIQPFANCHWIFCGPGNNGGDGLEAATHLQAWGQRVQVVLWRPHSKRPTDSEKALNKVQSLAIAIQDHLPLPSELQANDLIIDALLGVGIRDKADTNAGLEQAHLPRLEDWITHIYAYGPTILAVDIPSGLNANTGNIQDTFSIRLGNTSTFSDGPYPGNIYVAQLYNRVLSDSEVLQNYNAQKGRFGL